ncbi:Serine racemase [Hordeum vulgare]|nr:Serine racemase [Hordeum vulgare]
MESPPFKRNVAQDEDIISTLTDDLLLAILERLDLRDAVRAGAVSTRWWHLPHRLSRLELDARHFHGATVLDTMDAFTSTLLFVAFRWLTRLCLKGLAFGDSDVTDLINACDGLKQLTLSSCWMVEHSVLKINTPCSGLQELKFINFGRKWIELVSVPKLRQVTCFCWRFENPPVRFGYVPELHDVTFTCQAKVWQAPFLLSECLSTSVTNPWKLHLHFAGQMGTVCLELLEQVPKIDTIIVPISGGGLIYGVALAAKAINPSIRILAAEPKGADDLAQSKAAGRIIKLSATNTIADGLRAFLGDLTWPVVRDLVDDVIVVDDNAIVDAMKM